MKRIDIGIIFLAIITGAVWVYILLFILGTPDGNNYNSQQTTISNYVPAPRPFYGG